MDYQRWLSESESLQNAQMVANHFKGTDWTKESISAMCGNMRHESSINPDMYEYGYDWSADRGYGLVQWTPRSKYWDWAVANSLEPRNGDSMLSRIDYEVENNIQYYSTTDYPESFAEFRSNAFGKSVDYLTEAFIWNYERPNRQAGEDSLASRKAFANRCLNELDWTGTGGGGGNPSPTGGTASTTSNSTTQYQYEKTGVWEKMTYYKVKSGDTLSEIAKKHGVDIGGLMRVRFEKITNKNDLDVNEILLLPTTTKKVVPTKRVASTYVVQKGEALSTIAKRFNTSVASLASKNGIKDVNRIQAGQKIKI